VTTPADRAANLVMETIEKRRGSVHAWLRRLRRLSLLGAIVKMTSLT
jgi:hypothetical protein